MKTIRILFIGIMALALALASGSAEALLVLKIEDPALPNGVREVVDNETFDLTDKIGIITTLIEENGIDAIINAISAQTKTQPRLVLDTEGYKTFSDSATVSLTDTDFEILEQTPGTAFLAGVQDVGNVFTYTFSGDGANQPFVPGFTIKTGNAILPDMDTPVGEVLVAPVGSLTLSAVIEKGTSYEEALETVFTMVLQVGKSTLTPCPPAIIGEMLSKLGVVGDGCVIQDSTIEDGNVHVKDVSGGFTISNTVIGNGDLDIENVTGPVTVDGNRVTNGSIEIKQTDAARVTGNIVYGQISIIENNSPTITDNAFTDANMGVRDNTGQAVVSRNTGSGNANLQVDKNATVEVTDNRTNRDISCEENGVLTHDGNVADRKLECPKDDGLFGD
jgi:hypothetical protein